MRFEYYYKIPYWFRKYIFKPLIHLMAEKIKLTAIVKAKKYIERASIPYDKRINSYDYFREVCIEDFFEEDFLEYCGKSFDPYEIVSKYYYEAPAATKLDRHLYIDQILVLADNDWAPGPSPGRRA